MNSDPVKKKKVREAMWELWDDRIVDLKRRNQHLQEQVRDLQGGATKEVEARRAAQRELYECRKLVRSLQRALAELPEDPDEPRCDVPDLARIAAQLREREEVPQHDEPQG
jgi:hypothetical protein